MSSVVLSVGGPGDPSPVCPPGCAELSGGESTWIATGFTAGSGDGLDVSGGAVSELLPSCGMGGRVSCKSLKPCMHSGRRSVTKGKLGQGASSASRLYCQINRRTLDACRPASSTRIANTVPLLLHLADSIALTTAPLYRVQAWTDGRSRGQKRSIPATAARRFYNPHCSLHWHSLMLLSTRALTASDVCSCTASGTVPDGTPGHSFHPCSSGEVHPGGRTGPLIPDSHTLL